MTLTKKIFGISGLLILIISTFNGLSTFAQTSTQITINNDLFLNPSQNSPHTIFVCINGTLEKTITEKGKTSLEIAPGEKYIRILVNQVEAIRCNEGGSNKFEVYEDRVTLDAGTNTTFDISGEPKIHGVKSNQSMKVLETITNPGGNSMLSFIPTQGSTFEKVCIDGIVSSEARFREYFVTAGEHTISLATPSGECDSAFHLKLDIHKTTTTKIEVTNSLNYSDAHIKGVEVFDDVEDISPAVKHEIPVVVSAKVQEVPTKLAPALVATKSLPRSGGGENIMFIVFGFIIFGYVGYKNIKRKSLKIEV
jgi:hypothetical protein